jgi:hypothetical protein
MTFYNYVVRLPQNAADIAIHPEDDFVEAKWFPANEISTLTLSPPSLKTLQHLGYL